MPPESPTEPRREPLAGLVERVTFHSPDSGFCVLRSARAVQVNIEIMRAFVRLREILSSHQELAKKLEALEQKYDSQFRVVFEAIRQHHSRSPQQGFQSIKRVRWERRG